MQIALLVDNSQAAERYIRDYREALPAFISALHGRRAGRGQAPDRPHRARRAADDPHRLHERSRRAIQKAIDRVFHSSGSGAYLLDGIIETSQGITKRGNPRPVIVAIITEGPELSDRHFRQVLEPLRTSGAAFHIVTVGTPQQHATTTGSMVLDVGPKQSGGSLSTILVGHGAARPAEAARGRAHAPVPRHLRAPEPPDSARTGHRDVEAAGLGAPRHGD